MLNATPPKNPPFGRLLAWDPVKQKEAWRVEHVAPWNGGTLTTAGNLVFQGTADGRFVAYNATTGEKLWETPTGTGVVAAASTYMIDGKQYVSIAVGWGGVFGIAHPRHRTAEPRHGLHLRDRRQGAAAGLREVPDRRPVEGREVRSQGCRRRHRDLCRRLRACHGVPGVDKGGNVRNLGYVATETITNLKDIVFKGPFRDQGMPDFTGKLKEEDIPKLQAFIQGTADAIRPK